MVNSRDNRPNIWHSGKPLLFMPLPNGCADVWYRNVQLRDNKLRQSLNCYYFIVYLTAFTDHQEQDSVANSCEIDFQKKKKKKKIQVIDSSPPPPTMDFFWFFSFETHGSKMHFPCILSDFGQ